MSGFPGNNHMASDIRRHIMQTYVNLRVGMALIAFVFPLSLIVIAWLNPGFSVQTSLSAFYHTPLRNLFVSTLVTIGTCLYLYKGFSERENKLLNVAGVLAVLVAFLPTEIPAAIMADMPDYLPADPFTSPSLHTIVAVLFFLTIAYVCVYCSNETVQLISDPAVRKRYAMLYRLYGALMVLLPGIAAALGYLTVREYWVLVVEAIAMWVFAAFWLTKALEVRRQAGTLEQELIAQV